MLLLLFDLLAAFGFHSASGLYLLVPDGGLFDSGWSVSLFFLVLGNLVGPEEHLQIGKARPCCVWSVGSRNILECQRNSSIHSTVFLPLERHPCWEQP